jgi:histidinol-phosphate/aromatic aminotransferase/cobyric acid decarboxylase-like protein
MDIKEKIRQLKDESGSHSPSIATLLSQLPELKIKVDACFLSNPYATELFLKYFDQELIQSGKIKDVLEFYPPQNYDVSRFISKSINIGPENIFVGNGAIEVIQAVMHNFVKKDIVVVLPTFSSYYEFTKPHQQVHYYHLKKEENFKLNIEQYIQFVRDQKADSAVLINPNNPDGGYLPFKDLLHIIESLKNLEVFIIDESFIHFAYEDEDLAQITTQELIRKYPNVVIVKSMSKDFGIAGIRAGYGIMSQERVLSLVKNGYLWNVSGIADYFFKLYANEGFREEYEVVRKKYILNTMGFLADLQKVKNIKVYPSKANFALLEICSGKSSFDFCMDLLINSGIYVRDCSDKIGLEGNYVRVASRTFEENLKIVSGINKCMNA